MPENEFNAAAEIGALQSTMSDLQADIPLDDVRQRFNDLTAALAGLPLAVQQLRQRGYKYQPQWEPTAEALAASLRTLQTTVESEMDHQRLSLRYDANLLAEQVAALSSASSEAEVSIVKSGAESLRGKIDSAERTVENLFDDLAGQVEALRQQVETIARIYKQLDGATFRLLAEEMPVAMVAGKLMRDEKEGAKGFLFLTNNRLIFEQNEDIVKKKVLFIATEKEKVQKVLLDVGIGDIARVEESEKGGFMGIGKTELLGLTFGGNARQPGAIFQINEDSAEWRKLIRMVINGEVG